MTVLHKADRPSYGSCESSGYQGHFRFVPSERPLLGESSFVPAC